MINLLKTNEDMFDLRQEIFIKVKKIFMQIKEKSLQFVIENA